MVLKGGYVGAMPQQKAIANASAIARLNAGAKAMAESKAVAKAGDKFFKS